MAGPYHAAQSPEPFLIPRPDRHSWTYLSALSVTASRLSRFRPAHFLTSQSPRSLPAAPPPSKQTPVSATIPFAQPLIHHTPRSILQSRRAATSGIQFR